MGAKGRVGGPGSRWMRSRPPGRSRSSSRAMAERPDLILLTGDFVTRKRRYVPELTGLLEPLSAPLGVYAVLGNHDMVVGADAVSAAVEAAGARVLRNRHERV